MKDLSVLTPPLLTLAVVLLAIGAFLRHEMGRQRRDGDSAAGDDISPAQQNTDAEPDTSGEDPDRRTGPADR
jgi:hypothetical protein